MESQCQVYTLIGYLLSNNKFLNYLTIPGHILLDFKLLDFKIIED